MGGLQYIQYERKYRKQREVTNNMERIIYIYRYVWDQSKCSQKCRNVKHTKSRLLVLSKLLWKVGINSALSQRLLLEVKINSTWVPSPHPLQQLIDFITLYVTSIQRSPCLPSNEWTCAVSDVASWASRYGSLSQLSPNATEGCNKRTLRNLGNNIVLIIAFFILINLHFYVRFN